MRRCAELADRARATGDAPVGSLIVRGDAVIGEGVESVRAKHDVTAHAEIEAIRAASARVASHDLSGSTLYTSVAPCVMCAYAIRLAHIAVVVSGAPSGDEALPMSGTAVLTTAAILPTRPLPTLIQHRSVSSAAASAHE